METDAAASGSLMVLPRHPPPPAKHTHTHAHAHTSTHALPPACLTVLDENKCCSQERCLHAEYPRSLRGRQGCVISLVSSTERCPQGWRPHSSPYYPGKGTLQAFAQGLFLGKSSRAAGKRTRSVRASGTEVWARSPHARILCHLANTSFRRGSWHT